jgi:CRISPR-associated protein Csc2
MQRFTQFLGDIDNLAKTSAGNTKEYIHPRLKNLGSVSLVLIREAIAPVVFKNFEQEITDIEVETGGELYVRAVPNKFKYPERGRGLQILRAFKAGGNQPQNQTVLIQSKPGLTFDLNSFVFGDSVQKPDVLPVKAAVNYSDGLSVLPKFQCVGQTDHINAMEDGSLWDSETKKNSSNIFTRHFIKPGTLMVQVLSTRGCLLPPIGFDHLLLCIGLAGAYGGQTSVTGINIRTHILGIYGDKFEQAITSPYELVKTLPTDNPAVKNQVDKLRDYLHAQLETAHAVTMTGQEATAYQKKLLTRFEQEPAALATEYLAAHEKISQFFEAWFGKPPKEKKESEKKKEKAKGKNPASSEEDNE